MIDLIEPIRRSPRLPEIIKELEALWQAEQEKRHAFWADHDEGIKAEFIEGEVILYHSPIYGRHWKASSNLIRFLLPYVLDRQLGEVAYEKVMIRCTRNDYEPDICFWKKDKSQLFEAKQSAFPPPDFIIEILSDSTEERDRGVKMTDYALHQVQEYWLIDTDQKTVEQYLLKGEVYELNQKLKTGSIASQVIVGFEIKLAQIFEGF
ncbi:MAG: Uma2 family endonuclease [Microscillaceae bacterium]|jgi:Uma2 family endonuclease|nr:Uma2 family endonuclease [Microscillaceae bacterium]